MCRMIAVLVLALSAGCRRSSQKPTPVPPPAGDGTVERIDLDGQDVAELLGLNAWKYRVSVPDLKVYSFAVWVEDWRRDRDKPTIHVIYEGNECTRKEGTLLVNLPSKACSQLEVRTMLSNYANHRGADFDMGGSRASMGPDGKSLYLEEPFTLASFGFRGPEGQSLHMGPEDVVKSNPRAVFVKMAISEEPEWPLEPVFDDGDVVLEPKR